jgi:hypothetical protein
MRFPSSEEGANGHAVPSGNGYHAVNGHGANGYGLLGRQSPQRFGRALAEYVYNKCAKAKRYEYDQGAPNFDSWGKRFDDFVLTIAQARHCSIAAAQEHVRELVEDHVDNITDPYQPQKFAPNTICSSFRRIEEAKKRRERPEPEDPRDRPLN